MCDADPAVGWALMAQFGTYDGATARAAVTCPVRCIQGSMFPTRIEANRRHARSLDAVGVEGTGHFFQIEEPAEFNRKLREILGG